MGIYKILTQKLLLFYRKEVLIFSHTDLGRNQFYPEKSGFYALCQAVQILHRVVEKQQLFYLVFADPVPEGIAADAQQSGCLDLVVASFF